jgi:hypothetical protein
METKEIDPLDPQTVFTIKHSDIPKGVTQCENHSWEVLNDHEIICRKCMSVNIIDNIKDYA